MSFVIGTGRLIGACGVLVVAGVLTAVSALSLGSAAFAQTEQQQPAATSEDGDTAGEITSDRKSPLLSLRREREAVVVPVACAEGIRKDVELQPADASVTFTFNCLCSDNANELKQAMMAYRDDYMRVYRGEIELEDMGTVSDYFSKTALPFTSDGKGGTELTLLLEPGQQQEQTLYCYTAEDFKIIDDWAKYIIFGN